MLVALILCFPVDWASLAKQWIAQREVMSSTAVQENSATQFVANTVAPPPPPPPPPPVTDNNLLIDVTGSGNHQQHSTMVPSLQPDIMPIESSNSQGNMFCIKFSLPV